MINESGALALAPASLGCFGSTFVSSLFLLDLSERRVGDISPLADLPVPCFGRICPPLFGSFPLTLSAAVVSTNACYYGTFDYLSELYSFILALTCPATLLVGGASLGLISWLCRAYLWGSVMVCGRLWGMAYLGLRAVGRGGRCISWDILFWAIW